MVEARNIRSARRDKDDKRLSFAICAIIVGLFITNISVALGKMVGVSSSTVALLCKVFILLTLVICVPTIIRRLNVLLVLTVCVMVSVIAFNYVFFPSTRGIFTETASTFIMTIFPGMICFMLLENYELCLNKLVRMAYFIAIFNAVFCLLSGKIQFDSSYSMGYANAVILPTNILIYALFKRKQKVITKILTLALIATNIIGVMVYGSRGALAAIAVFFLVYGAKVFGKKIKPGFKVIIALLLSLCVIFYKQIFTVVYNIVKAMGFDSRTLYLFTTNIGHDSGRGELWNKILDDFWSNPFIMRGINADYLVVNGYSHNFFLELLYSLGILLGGAFSIYVIYQIIRTVRSRSTSFDIVRLLALFSFFPLCLWSLSVWTSSYFWLWIVMCWREKKFKDTQEISL